MRSIFWDYICPGMNTANTHNIEDEKFLETGLFLIYTSNLITSEIRKKKVLRHTIKNIVVHRT
jgi:hypothetical protein